MSAELKKALPWSFFIWLVGGLVWGYSLNLPGEAVGFMTSDLVLIALLIVGGVINVLVSVLHGVKSSEEEPFFILMYKVAVGLIGSFVFAKPDVLVLAMLAIVLGLALISQFWKPMNKALKK